jgi:hypothetical protein
VNWHHGGSRLGAAPVMFPVVSEILRRRFLDWLPLALLDLYSL